MRKCFFLATAKIPQGHHTVQTAHCALLYGMVVINVLQIRVNFIHISFKDSASHCIGAKLKWLISWFSWLLS